jgi:hypothetical protein
MARNRAPKGPDEISHRSMDRKSSRESRNTSNLQIGSLVAEMYLAVTRDIYHALSRPGLERFC